MEENPEYASPLPKRIYGITRAEQLAELKDDIQLKRFVASRKRLAEDRYRPLYHYVNPEGRLNDPNGLCYWRGNYHLFYQAYPPEDPRQHWGHAISKDLVHWCDLPLALYPGIERCCFSGSTLVEDDRVIAFYHGTQAGNMAAVASDPLLLNWEKIPGNPVIPNVDVDAKGLPYRVYDPCIWREAEGYYSLSGTYWEGEIFVDCRMVQHLFFSQDLQRWSYLGPFIEGDEFTAPGEDGAVPYFWPLGDRYILLFASHQRGSQYLIGDYDKVHHRFKVNHHGRFNFGSIDHGGVHAPSAMPDGNGGVNVIYNINGGKATPGWDHLMSLVRYLTLRPDGQLGIEPVAAVERLRGRRDHLESILLPANEEIVLEGIAGNTMELVLEIDPQEARDVCLKVLRSPGAEEYTSITFYRDGGMQWNGVDQQHLQDALVMDISRASLAADVTARPPEVAPFGLAVDEILCWRIFVDRSVVEVFANGRQCLAQRVYPERQDSLGVSVRVQGSVARLCSLDAWQMKSIWDTEV